MRQRGHEAFGIDPTPQVLQVAGELFDAGWFRQFAAGKLDQDVIKACGLPKEFEVIVLAGNVPAFLTPGEFQSLLTFSLKLLADTGVLIIGTTARGKGGTEHQDELLAETPLQLVGRFSDWHLSVFDSSADWSVSVYAKSQKRSGFTPPDGIFVLPS